MEPIYTGDAKQLSDKEFWLKLSDQDLHIGKENQKLEIECLKLPDDFDKQKKLFELEGYLHIQNYLDIEFDFYNRFIKKLFDLNLPPVFAFVYDEFWEIHFKLKALVNAFLGEGAKLMPTIWIWYVDASKEKEILGKGENKELAIRSMFSGFYGPHRDKGYRSLYKDGSPKILSFWLPLTKASPLNSCIYIVPANRDPTYNTAEDESWLFKRADIRALPAKPGDILFWNEAVLHWASRPAPNRDIEPRISMGFEYVDSKYKEKCSHFDLDYLPDFKTRLEIIAVQFKLYLTDEGFPPELIGFIKDNARLIKEGKEDFS